MQTYPIRVRIPSDFHGRESMVLRLRNTLTRQVEEISTIEPGVVRMYTCGPTVYRYAHIGNLRTYLMADWIRRILIADGNEVYHIKNITDVGHLTDDGDLGEDKRSCDHSKVMSSGYL